MQVKIAFAPVNENLIRNLSGRMVSPDGHIR